MAARLSVHVPGIGDTNVIATSGRQALEFCVDLYHDILRNEDLISVTCMGSTITRTVAEIKHGRITSNPTYQFTAYMEGN